MTQAEVIPTRNVEYKLLAAQSDLDFPEALAAALGAFGLNDSDLAEALGYTKGAISRMKRRKNMQASTFGHIIFGFELLGVVGLKREYFKEYRELIANRQSHLDQVSGMGGYGLNVSRELVEA